MAAASPILSQIKTLRSLAQELETSSPKIAWHGGRCYTTSTRKIYTPFAIEKKIESVAHAVLTRLSTDRNVCSSSLKAFQQAPSETSYNRVIEAMQRSEFLPSKECLKLLKEMQTHLEKLDQRIAATLKTVPTSIKIMICARKLGTYLLTAVVIVTELTLLLTHHILSAFTLSLAATIVLVLLLVGLVGAAYSAAGFYAVFLLLGIELGEESFRCLGLLLCSLAVSAVCMGADYVWNSQAVVDFRNTKGAALDLLVKRLGSFLYFHCFYGTSGQLFIESKNSVAELQQSLNQLEADFSSSTVDYLRKLVQNLRDNPCFLPSEIERKCAFLQRIAEDLDRYAHITLHIPRMPNEPPATTPTRGSLPTNKTPIFRPASFPSMDLEDIEKTTLGTLPAGQQVLNLLLARNDVIKIKAALQLQNNAPIQALLRNLKRLQLLYHPDKCPQNTPSLLPMYNKIIRFINGLVQYFNESTYLIS